MRYTVKKGETDDDGKCINPKIEKFDSRYILKNGRWITADSLKLMELGFEL